MRTARTLARLNQRDGFGAPGVRGPRRRDTASTPSSVKTAPRPWPRKPPPGASAPSSLPPTRFPNCSTTPTIGSVSRAGSPTRWCCVPAPRTTSRSSGMRRSRSSPTNCAPWTPRRRGVLHLGAHLQRGRVPLSVADSLLRHQQHAGLLQHVPRIVRHRVASEHRDRQGFGVGARSGAGRPDPDRGPESGHQPPRMLSVLEKAKANGAKVIAINPLPEAGLLRFKDPQKVHGVVGHGVAIADDFLQIRVGETRPCSRGSPSSCSRPRTAIPARYSTGSSSTRTVRASTTTPRTSARSTSTPSSRQRV